jgi:hypothetical protein
MTKLANWNATLSLFADEYQVPLLPPAFRSSSWVRAIAESEPQAP